MHPRSELIKVSCPAMNDLRRPYRMLCVCQWLKSSHSVKSLTVKARLASFEARE